MKKILKKYIKTSISAQGFRNIDPLATALPILRAFNSNDNSLCSSFCITPDLTAAEKIYAELLTLNQELELNLNIVMLPETIRGRQFVSDGEDERARVLYQMLAAAPNIIVTSVHAVTAETPEPEYILNCQIDLKCGLDFELSDLIEKLLKIDYDDELEVKQCGEFSRRGGILDIFSPAHEQPCRIEFFGNEIDSLRLFDPVTQRSTETIKEYKVIAPHPSMVVDQNDKQKFNAFDFIPNAQVIVLFPDICRSKLETFAGSEFTDIFDLVIQQKTKNNRLFQLLDPVASSAHQEFQCSECYPPLAHLLQNIPPEAKYGANEIIKELIQNQIRQWLTSKYKITLSYANQSSPEQIHRWCSDCGFKVKDFKIVNSSIAAGVMLPAEKQIILTEHELFTANAFKGAVVNSNAFKSNVLSSEQGENEILSALAEGDYAVHLDHGIARFRGISIVENRGVKREVMRLEFKDEVMLHVPLSQAHLVSRYLGASSRVVLHKLGASRWMRDKANAGRAVRAYASDMLKIQAFRESSLGISFPQDDLNTKLFLGAFPYTDTPDQTRSTQEISSDMERARPMDRLLCGDVGYGKTEVAMRAAFKAISAGFQVAVLTPTTVLAQQHFISFKERFAEEPYNIDMLSRFRSPQEQREIFERLKNGGIDIIIGTHGLCAPSIKFANLGLVIIDEEQRFGVRHKEMLRHLRAEVDVLTLSATPIPRTLYLAMVGARDLSTLQTAPRARLAVKTVVAPEDINIVKAAINEEVERGGQVYYLHNRVKTIEECCDNLAREMPQVRFAFAHGQMKENQLEEVMNRFMNHEIDCLVCSTIIESGLDIPNANTIIIERADRFGLSALYQLRGRVGRRNQQAFAYMLLPKNMLISSDARKRMAAIKRCSELGAGFQLALRDLEIRGSGNILGEEQSGHLNLIGFDLYCRLLKDEIANLQGLKSTFLPSVELSIDFMVFGYEVPLECLAMAISPDYIDGEQQRLKAYRRLSALNSLAEIDEFKIELIDRYGKLPECVENLLTFNRFRVMTALSGFASLVVADGNVMLNRNGSSSVYRENGRIPYIDKINPLPLRVALLREILRRATAKKESNDRFR